MHESEPSKGPPRDSIIAGKYRVESTLGFGAMGIVLAAHHLQLDERVAIKIMRGDVQLEPEHIERFLREAQSAARLKSENVARVDDVGTLPDGKPYMVMELLDGLDLGRLLEDQGQVSRAFAVDMVLQVCDALAEAHSHGIIHRDIKPTNLFITSRRDGSPLIKVLDFGISKAASASDLSLTQTSSVLGTPAYMSPEQMRSARTADARSDIWSLATVLYELVEGTTPFEATNFAELCVAVATENPRDMVNAPEIQPVIARALAKSSDDRYPSIAELADELVPFTSDPQRAARQVNRIFRLLGKTPPHPGARDSTPALIRTRGSAPTIPTSGLESGAPLRAHTFTSEESSTVADAAPTIYGARRGRPLWLAGAALALLAIGAAATVIYMSSTRDDARVGSADVTTTREPPAAPSSLAAAPAASPTPAAAPSPAPPPSPSPSAPAPSPSPSPSPSLSLAPAAVPAPPAPSPPASPAPHHAPIAHAPIAHAPLPHHSAPHHPAPPVPQAGSAATPSPAVPPRTTPKCDPFANPKGCPAAKPSEQERP